MKNWKLALLSVVCVAVAIFVLEGVVAYSYISSLDKRISYLENKRPDQKELVLDAHTPIIARWETADGEQVLPPKRMELWQYVDEEAQRESQMQQNNFLWAFEEDLHKHDLTFHLSHEYIDGKKW